MLVDSWDLNIQIKNLTERELLEYANMHSSSNIIYINTQNDIIGHTVNCFLILSYLGLFCERINILKFDKKVIRICYF